MTKEAGHIQEMRRRLGSDAAQKGEKPHEGASKEFLEGYKRRSGFGGSNVMPRKFGKGGASERQGWDCYCGYQNKSNRIARKGNEEVCWFCGVQRSYCEVREEHD